MSKKVAFKAQIGSANYNLLLPSSDQDFVTVYYPSFEDLYNRVDLAKPSKVTETEDNSWQDVRKLRDGLIKSNPNTLEILFSVNVKDIQTPLWEELHHIREDIAKMNLSHLFDASFGMFHNEMKRYKRELEKGDKVRAGKAASSGLRIILAMHQYHKQDFKGYSNCLWYGEYLDAGTRNTLLEIKAGKGDPEAIKNKVAVMYKRAEVLRPLFHANTKDAGVEKEVRDIVYHYTEKEVKNELLFGGNY
ncbi:nucleotidyltransferase [Bacillus phage Moonbeam]|uniref:Nucleotidyltransferase n=1 Tax=Bacillus phage Moonbeam TaxID=1540091 RepID=A0A0A0RP58_9CAUD|nr:nucleotidyltransferase [Bacillus phage Moonbeam]AIW03419.1 nucleotidyltransferase [Bacillus phage Moonbeam]